MRPFRIFSKHCDVFHKVRCNFGNYLDLYSATATAFCILSGNCSLYCLWKLAGGGADADAVVADSVVGISGCTAPTSGCICSIKDVMDLM